MKNKLFIFLLALAAVSFGESQAAYRRFFLFVKESALHTAARYPNVIDFVNVLEQYPENINTYNEINKTPLYLVLERFESSVDPTAKNTFILMARLLVNKGADISFNMSVRTNYYVPLIVWASMYSSRLQILAVLLTVQEIPEALLEEAMEVSAMENGAGYRLLLSYFNTYYFKSGRPATPVDSSDEDDSE